VSKDGRTCGCFSGPNGAREQKHLGNRHRRCNGLINFCFGGREGGYESTLLMPFKGGLSFSSVTGIAIKIQAGQPGKRCSIPGGDFFFSRVGRL
jgi:hypothetical protein